MESTIFYNYVALDLKKCEEDLQIFFAPGDGLLKDIQSVGSTYTGNPIYKLYVGSTYVLGPHIVTNAFDDCVKINSCYNIYKITKMMPCTPIFRNYGSTMSIFELIEAKVVRTSNKITYLDFLYGD